MAPTDTLAPRLPSHPRARRWARADPTSRPSGRREARTSRSTVKRGGGGGVGPQLNRNVTTEGQEAASAPKWRCLGGGAKRTGLTNPPSQAGYIGNGMHY